MKKTLFFLALFFLLFQKKVFAIELVDITQGNLKKLAISIQNFKNYTPKNESAVKMEKDFYAVLEKDLKLSGYFRLIDPSSFIEPVERSGFDGSYIIFQNWRVIGTEILVVGSIKKELGSVIVEGRAYDVSLGELLLARTYVFKENELIKTAHKFSDEIIFKLTGLKGLSGTKIAFIYNEEGPKEVYTVDFDGSNLKKITSNKSINLSPRWDNTGKRLVFTSYRDKNPDLFTKELDSGIEKKISSHRGLNISGVFSPDGKEVAMTLSRDGNSEIYILNLENKQLVRVTDDRGIDVSPSWSPDGSKIAFVSDRGGSPQIYSMNKDGSDVVRLTFAGNYNVSPSWSPDGSKIAFSGRVNGNFDIFVMNADGSDVTRLTMNKGDNEAPSFSPNGKAIVFASNRTGKYGLYVINLDGNSDEIPIFLGKGNAIAPSWSPFLE